MNSKMYKSEELFLVSKQLSLERIEDTILEHSVQFSSCIMVLKENLGFLFCFGHQNCLSYPYPEDLTTLF